MRLTEIEAVVEALLFLSGDAVSLTMIAQTVELDKATTKAVVKSLADKFEQEQRGLRIIELDGSYQMCTAAECFEFIRNMYKNTKKQGMTQALLETLAIIAYKQPITKVQIEEIRGVNSDHSVNKLVEKKLVCEAGRQNAPGKPILFRTTNEFLRYFGFKSLHELPALEELSPEEEMQN